MQHLDQNRAIVTATVAGGMTVGLIWLGLRHVKRSRLGQAVNERLETRNQIFEITKLKIRYTPVHEKTNCLTDMVFEAEDWAKEIDEKVKNGEIGRFPLYGIPFSVKESLWMKGYYSTAGYARKLLNPAAQADQLTVQILRDHGAIPFVRTNLPQSMFSFGCCNPVYGRTTNFHNTNRTPGGSSGGDAALLAGKGAIFGIGSDIAGSIRLPAHFSGVYGIKPSMMRISNLNGTPFNPGRAHVYGTCGPLSIDVQSLEDVMAVLCAAQSKMVDRDPMVMPIPWTPTSKPNLRIGWFDTCDFFPTVPAVQKAVNVARKRLEAAGHTLVPFEIPDLGKGMGLNMAACFNDNAVDMMKTNVADLPNVDDSDFHFCLSLGHKFRTVYLTMRNDTRNLSMFNMIPRNLTQLHKLYAQLTAYRRQVLIEWQGLGLDAVLCPPCASVATTPEQTMQVPGIFLYTAIFNLLDLPGGVSPIAKVTEDDIKQCHKYKTIDRSGEIVKSINTSSDSINLPVGVQVVALPYREEMVLHVMKEIEKQ